MVKAKDNFVKKTWLILVAALLTSCSVGGIPPDGGPLRHDAQPPEHICDPELVSSDFHHCGACGSPCSVRDSDRCVDSICMCGIHAECGPGQDCRRGFCVDTDPLGMECEFDQECQREFACIEGRCSFVSCFPEVCDGLDNDCDGVVDGSETSPLAEWCYSGPETSPLDIMSPCSAGVRVCEMGVWTECIGESPPIPESGLLACNGIDDNCDGCTDGVRVDGLCQPIITDGFEIVFLLDPSGSMSDESAAVRDAMSLFSSTFDRTDFRWAIVLVPGYVDGVPQMYQDFTDHTGIVDALDRISVDDVLAAKSLEPTYDGLYRLARRELGLSFSDASVKIFIMFTDEGGQSFENPMLDEEDACDSIVGGEVFVLFDEMYNWGEFSCADYHFELTSDYVSMADDLESVIQDPCL